MPVASSRSSCFPPPRPEHRYQERRWRECCSIVATRRWWHTTSASEIGGRSSVSFTVATANASKVHQSMQSAIWEGARRNPSSPSTGYRSDQERSEEAKPASTCDISAFDLKLWISGHVHSCYSPEPHCTTVNQVRAKDHQA
jgi:hypothetical protein